MLTPPPSPLSGQKPEKARTARRFRWIAVLGPGLLVLITLSTRYITHPGIFDVFTGTSTDSVWSPHKRHLDLRDNSNTTQSSTSPTSTLPITAQPVPTVPTSAVVPTPFPQPWDSSIQQNFSSSSCYDFFNNMTNTEPFRECRPLSLLLQTSSALVQAQKNLTLLNSIIWGTCQTTLSHQQCLSNMAWFATALRSACTQEIGDNNTNVVNALTGLQAFDLMFNVGCLPDPSTNSYCYLDAVHNSNPSDVYIYQLPLGLAYPNATTPTCSACAKSVMAIYVNQLQNSTTSSALSVLQSNYPGAEQSLVTACGANYAKAISSAIGRSRPMLDFVPLAASSVLMHIWFS